jgi:hypothetical protein
MPSDKFEISMLKPSKSNGQEWYLGDDAENDDRFDTRGDNIGGNAEDGFYTNESDFRYHVLTTKGYKSPGTKDHSEWIERGYISYPEDWRNIEFTGEFKYDGSDDFSLYTRSGVHTGDNNCEGTKYSASLRSNGDCRFAKETWHNQGYAFTDWKSSGLGNVDNEWVRIKFICYDVGQISSGAKDHVRLEFWIDPDFNNSWKLANSTTDTGENWGEGGEECGTSEKATFLFGGPFTTLRGDAANRVSFRKMSVREIDINGSFAGGGGGGSGGTGTTDPPATNIPGTGNPQIDPVSIGKDKFGISMLFPTPVGGWQWINNWDNGTAYNNQTAIDDPWFHPTDPFFSVEDNPGLTFSINGQGIMTISVTSGTTDYRIKVYDPNDQKRFINVEATAYYYWDNVNYANSEEGLGTDTIRVGTDHHFSTKNCPYNAHDYHANIRREGQIYIGREALHPIEHPARPDPGMGINGSKQWWPQSQNIDKPPIKVWVGFKFIKRLIDGGKNVLLQIYRDLTDGVNGGDWTLLMEFKHIQGNWQDESIDEQIQQLIDRSFEQLNDCRIPPSCDCPDPVHNHSGGMCYLRGNPVSSLKIKKLSFREITDADTPLPNQPGGCPPGFRRDTQGNCVPIDGSGGSGSIGDPAIVFKDFVDVYHIGTTDADSCNIVGLTSTDDLTELYTVDESDEFYELYQGLRTQAGIFIATTASKLMNWTARKFRFFLAKFGLPSGLIYFHVNDANGVFKYEIGRIAAELLTPDFEEYTFTIPSHNIAFGLNWGIWISFQGGSPEAFIKVAVKSGNPFDGAHTTAIRFGAGTAREQMLDHDLCGNIWH